jgi:hypothetical protein
MKTTTIPFGYRLTIMSWENDGDNHANKTISGLGSEMAHFYVGLAQLCEEGWGNMYEPSEPERGEFNAACVKMVREKLEAFKLPVHWKDFDDEKIKDMCNDAKDTLGLVSCDYFTRVTQSILVEYLPNTIVLQDVTDEFLAAP